MKRPRRFLRETAALVRGGARAAGVAGGQRAPAAGPGTCGLARARTPQDPLRDLSLPAPPAQLSRGTAGVGAGAPEACAGFCIQGFQSRARRASSSSTRPTLLCPHLGRTPAAREQVTHTKVKSRGGTPRGLCGRRRGTPRQALVQSVLGRRWGPATATPPPPQPPHPRRPGATRRQRGPSWRPARQRQPGTRRAAPIRCTRGERARFRPAPALPPSHNPRRARPKERLTVAARPHLPGGSPRGPPNPFARGLGPPSSSERRRPRPSPGRYLSTRRRRPHRPPPLPPGCARPGNCDARNRPGPRMDRALPPAPGSLSRRRNNPRRRSCSHLKAAEPGSPPSAHG